MRTNSRMRGPGLGLAVLALVVSLPELARAQQSGLFPLSPIRRQRVPCDQQDPIYKTYKYQYFGYHPTCWRRFPDGWGCPSPDAPDKAKSFRDIPRSAGEPEPEALPDEGPARPDGTKPPVPPLPPGGRSPFEELDTGKPSNAPAAPRGGQAPLTLPPGDPFRLDDKPGNPPAAAPNPPRASRLRPATPPALSNGPELSAPAEERGRMPASRTSRIDADEATDARAEDGPLLALPNVNLPPVHDSAIFGTEPPQATAANDAGTNSTTSPVTSPPRRGFLSGLFNNLGLNWTRR
ncbi:MAG: hypothetical protein ACHRXM_28375 [Isosphaerales bacterium]